VAINWCKSYKEKRTILNRVLDMKINSIARREFKLQTKSTAPNELPSMKRIPPMPLRAIAPATKNFICS